MKLLAADIGGTKTLLGIAEIAGDGLRILHEQRYGSTDHGTFDAMVEAFIASHDGPKPDRACFAVAGPISAGGRKAHVTNVGWDLDASHMEARLGISPIRLINDFQAQAYGIGLLQPQDMRILQAGTSQPHGLRAVIGAGTGLGIGQLVWRKGHYHALPSEGGHADFAPHGALARDLHAWLSARRGDYVSVEHVLSGPGLGDIYRFLADRHPARATAELARAMQDGDPAAAVWRHAREAGDTLARAALELFVSSYGSHAGNLALITLPYGGLFVSGGIAPRILDLMIEDDRFITAFNDKGKMAELTRSIPVAVVTNPRVGLLGALEVARGE